jgi:hypothetical protein
MVLDVAGAAELRAGHRLHGRQATAAQPWALLESWSITRALFVAVPECAAKWTSRDCT